MRYLFIFCFCSVWIKGYTQTITWDQSRKLQWSDFKVRKDTLLVDTAASTYSGLRCFIYKRNIWIGKFKYHVVAEFNSDLSYYFPLWINNNLLVHEQIHFDITEVYAKKIQKIFDAKGWITDKEAKILFDRVYEELQLCQAKFDIETDHGRKINEQLSWRKNIDSQLQ